MRVFLGGALMDLDNAERPHNVERETTKCCWPCTCKRGLTACGTETTLCHSNGCQSRPSQITRTQRTRKESTAASAETPRAIQQPTAHVAFLPRPIIRRLHGRTTAHGDVPFETMSQHIRSFLLSRGGGGRQQRAALMQPLLPCTE